MKTFTLAVLSLTAFFPLPAIAMPDPLGLPLCYMVTSSNRVVDLTSMCDRRVLTASQSTPSSITADDVCRAFAADIFAAQNEFQKQRAEEGFRFCRQNKAAIQDQINSGN